MNLIELLTIYLTIGAPFGVYFYLKNRGNLTRAALIAQTIGAVLGWFYYAFRLLDQRLKTVNFAGSKTDAGNQREKQIEIVNRQLQKAFIGLTVNSQAYSIFEFREVLDRYIGLSLATQNSAADDPAGEHELELFRLAGHAKKELKLAGQIMHRKNYLRLKTHQIAARLDFLKISRRLYEQILFPGENSNGKIDEWRSYQFEALRLTNLLDDSDAERDLRQLNIEEEIILNGNQEDELWKTISENSINLNTRTAAAQTTLLD